MIEPIKYCKQNQRCDDYEELYNIISTLIAINPREDILESIYTFSEFSRVKIEKRNYVVGLIGDTLCFGIPVFSKCDIPYKMINTNAVFIPALKSKPESFGYYLVFKNKDK